MMLLLYMLVGVLFATLMIGRERERLSDVGDDVMMFLAFVVGWPLAIGLAALGGVISLLYKVARKRKRR